MLILCVYITHEVSMLTSEAGGFFNILKTLSFYPQATNMGLITFIYVFIQGLKKFLLLCLCLTYPSFMPNPSTFNKNKGSRSYFMSSHFSEHSILFCNQGQSGCSRLSCFFVLKYEPLHHRYQYFQSTKQGLDMLIIFSSLIVNDTPKIMN